MKLEIVKLSIEVDSEFSKDIIIIFGNFESCILFMNLFW